MKKNKHGVVVLIIAFLIANISNVISCDLCKSQQPEILQDVTHGMGPQGTVDYIIVWSGIIIVSITLILSLKYMIVPKEKKTNHIKYSILKTTGDE